jgi:hypothetical protein
MSHVDDGTLHAYLDGELSPPEAQGVAGHLTQCPGCRGRLEEERAVITRATKLLGRAAPPDRELPPFRPGDVKPLARLWWKTRLPLAWAATVALALGIGMYLGGPSGTHRVPAADDLPNAAPARATAAAKPREPRADAAMKARRETVAALSMRDEIAAAPEGKRAAAKPAAPSISGTVSLGDGRYVLKGPSVSVDSARLLLDADPLEVPDLPIRGIYRARLRGYSAVVVVEQALDSSTVIEVISGRRAPIALEAAVATGAGVERVDTPSAGARALLGRNADVPAAVAPTQDVPPPSPLPRKARRPAADLFLDIRGPLSVDSLAALRRLLQPLRP